MSEDLTTVRRAAEVAMATAAEDAIPESIRQRFVALKEKADGVLEQAKSLKVIDEPSRTVGTQLIVMAGTQARELEDLRLLIVDPLNKYLSRINGLFNPTIKTLQATKQTLARNVGLYVLETERKAKAAREAARLEAERITAQVKAEALDAKMTPQEADQLAQLYATEAPQPAPAPTSFEGASLRRGYDFEVLNINEVPTFYLKREVLRAEILNVIKAHVARHGEPPTISGLRIFPIGTMVQK